MGWSALSRPCTGSAAKVAAVCQTEIVPEFCTCGAQLPPDARFCHKCGKPQYDYMPAVEESEPEPAPPQPAMLAELQPLLVPTDISFHNGLAVRIGFIAAMGAVMISLFPIPWPFVRLPIAFLAAGFLAVFLYSRRTGQTAQHSQRRAHRLDHRHLFVHVSDGSVHGGDGGCVHPGWVCATNPQPVSRQ